MMNCAQVVTVSSTYQPIRINKKRCRLHPNRENCTLIQTKGQTKIINEHYTLIDSRYCSTNGDPYYEWLLFDQTTKRDRLYLIGKTVCGVKFETSHDEQMRYVLEAGERDPELIRTVMRYVHKYLNNDTGNLNGHADEKKTNDSKIYVLFEEMYISCLYSCRRCVVLPQEMYCLYKDGYEPHINSCFSFNTIPEYEESNASQDIYKSFLVYNTVLTMMLRQKNPFNDKTKVISKVIESIGTCNGGEVGGKKTRIKVCELDFGGETPGHVLCPPKEIVRRVYRYSKWRLNPKNYTRYYTLLMRDDEKSKEYLREWSIFLTDFKTYFFPT
ncbi:VP1054 [Diatraea saccharalis granulovirus]|uniref:VP1054 n=1 Tax=Diatraea saccharalis granulovirus TaxID=1675862 RepID=A0A0R7EYX8_9BBAC|nr:VP1054 [Diatraea saccharalis granulovirus]AKN80764.1 VP1054 [Diatraea saccharalis granulovirus]